MTSPKLFMRILTLTAAALIFIASTRLASAQDADPSVSLRDKPLARWTQAERELGFRTWESRVTVRPVRKGAVTRALVPGEPLFAAKAADSDKLARFIEEYKVAGIVVVHDGKLRLERYALGHTAQSKWTSFSVAKSLTSTLVGAALKDGALKSIDDPIGRYIKGLAGSGYEKVTVRQLLTMTSGVAWNEDYTDPKADVYQLFRTPPEDGLDATTSYMRKLKRNDASAGKWLYNTGETNLVGILVREATKKPLAVYASEKIWTAIGAEQDASWQLDPTDAEVAGCCIQATTRDFARFGLFISEGAKANGTSIVPDGYLEDATRKQADINAPGRGYGYQWWTRDDGTFDAVGIHGQYVHIDRARKLVVAINSAWPRATDTAFSIARNALVAQINAVIDQETKSAGKQP